MERNKAAESEKSMSPNDYLPIFIKTDDNNEQETGTSEKEISSFRRALPQILAFSVQNLLQFGYGMSQGFPTIAIPAILNSAKYGDKYGSVITINEEQISWLSSINLICMPVGCIFSGIVAQSLGKRRAMQFVNFPMLAAWIIFYYSTCTMHIYVALCLVGFGGGLMESPVTTYIAEITDPKYRGVFTALATFCVSLGVLLQFLLGSLMDWRLVALVSATVPIISIVTLFFVPESPVWLIQERRFLDGVQALQWLRGWVPEHKVKAEFRQLFDELITQKENEIQDTVQSRIGWLKRKLHMWHKRSFWVPFLLVLYTFFICHFCGKTPIRTYAVPIFETLKAPIDKNHATILLGASEMIATLLGAMLIQSTGKRHLMFTSMLGTGICVLGIAIFTQVFNIKDLTGISSSQLMENASTIVPVENISIPTNIPEVIKKGMELASQQPKPLHFDSNNLQDHSILLWLLMIMVLCVGFFANLAIRMMPWVLIGEVFSADIRNSASGFAGGMGYLFGFLANKLFLIMLYLLTLPGTFVLYACVTFFGMIVINFTLPETEGRTLGEIEAHFSKKSKVNLLRKRADCSKPKSGRK